MIMAQNLRFKELIKWFKLWWFCKVEHVERVIEHCLWWWSKNGSGHKSRKTYKFDIFCYERNKLKGRPQNTWSSDHSSFIDCVWLSMLVMTQSWRWDGHEGQKSQARPNPSEEDSPINDHQYWPSINMHPASNTSWSTAELQRWKLQMLHKNDFFLWKRLSSILSEQFQFYPSDCNFLPCWLWCLCVPLLLGRGYGY